MEDIKDLGGLLMHHLQNLYSAEEQMKRTMPLVIEKVVHPSLQKALKHHLSLTDGQMKRLEQVASMLAEKLGGARKGGTKNSGAEKKGTKDSHIHIELNGQYTCKGMEGLIEEANELMELRLSKDVTDAAIIACVQKMEHYEICTYGTALAYAEQLHLSKAAALLEETLDEEYDADDLLTTLATSAFNKEAEPEGLKNEDIPDAIPVNVKPAKATEHITERNINSPGGRAGTSHRRYQSGESRGH